MPSGLPLKWEVSFLLIQAEPTSGRRLSGWCRFPNGRGIPKSTACRLRYVCLSKYSRGQLGSFVFPIRTGGGRLKVQSRAGHRPIVQSRNIANRKYFQKRCQADEPAKGNKGSGRNVGAYLGA